MEKKAPSPALPLNLDEQLEFCSKNNKTPVMILTTGSFCPIHKGHLYSLIDAKNFLENNFPYKVLQILISPSNNEYVSSKSREYNFPQYYLTFNQRCSLIDETIKLMEIKEEIEQNLFRLDKWEGNNKNFIDFPSVWLNLNEYLVRFFKSIIGFKLFYSLGSDMIVSTRVDIHRSQLMPLLITERNLKFEPKYIEEYRNLFLEKKFEEMEKKNLFYLKPSKEYSKYSSTLLRECIKKKIDDGEVKYEELIFGEVGKKIKEFYEKNVKNKILSLKE